MSSDYTDPKATAIEPESGRDDEELFAKSESEMNEDTDTVDDDSDVKLTDISEIVSKYAVVDTVFEDTDDSPPEADEADASEDASPKIAFRRLRSQPDPYSKWSDNARRATRDMRVPGASADASDEVAEPVRLQTKPEVLKNHRRRLVRSIGISVGLPIVGGALFALLLYVQKDLKPSGFWGWFASTSTATIAEIQPTPDFARHPEYRADVTGQPETPKAVSAKLPPSPESGIIQAATPDAKPDRQNTVMGDPPAASPNPVYMARLTVSDTQGSALEPIPLSLAVAPGVPGQRLRIRISGLPEGARLSKGSDLGNGEWLLQEDDLENLDMTLAPDYSGQITLLAEVIDDATHIQAAPSQVVAVDVVSDEMVVKPAAASPENAPRSFAEPDDDPVKEAGPTQIVPTPSPFAELRPEPMPALKSAPETKVATLTPPTAAQPAAVEDEPDKSKPLTENDLDNSLLAMGDQHMSNGDIAAARLLYERALKKGDPRAATAIGRSYDPLVYSQLRVHGVLPDPNQAIEWYRRGAENGDSKAAAHIQALAAWLKK